MKTFYTESSSRIVSVSYDEASKTLRVEFTRGGVYEYFAVPEEVYTGFITARSLGQYLNVEVRGKFEYRKII